jgi:hypothetical protein
MDFGNKIKDTNKTNVVSIGQNDLAVPGAYYEAIYTVGPLNQFFPGWEQRAYDDIRAQLASNCPSCEIVYCHIEQNGQIVVQWQYNSPGGYSSMVAGVVWVVVILIAAAVFLYMANVLVGSVTQFAKENSTDFTMIVIAGVIISAAILFFAATNAYKTYKIDTQISD